MHKYWQRQLSDEPLFPDLLWSRPENRAHAGKLLIVGGNAYGFAAPAEAYTYATAAGIGTARVILPDSLQKTVGKVFAAGEYAPSTPSGSFSQRAIAELLAMSQWSDGVLLAGDIGRNSETAIVLEKFSAKYDGQLVITKEVVDYYISAPTGLTNRQNTTLVLSFAQLQKLGTNLRFATAFRFEMDFLALVETLHDFTKQYPFSIVVKHLQTIFVAHDGRVSSTKLANDLQVWRVKAASQAVVWRIQNATKPFEALTTAIAELVPRQ